MKPIVRELLFQTIGHLHDEWTETKNKTVYKLKQSVAKFMYNEGSHLSYDVFRSGLKLNSYATEETRPIMLALLCMFRAIDELPKSKLVDKWCKDGMKLYNEVEFKPEMNTGATNRLLDKYPVTKDDYKG